ncbi:MAG TPA: SWIM zinc finger domain-containing protein, partial [Chloroflexota bacterium]
MRYTRDEVLARLRRSRAFDVASRVEIFLHEGLVDDAIAAVERLGAYPDYALLERVVEAAIPSHPDWVMRTGREQAEAIVAGGYAQHYDRAARWLRHAGRAAAAAGRTDEWRAQVQALLEEHRRKYKL